MSNLLPVALGPLIVGSHPATMWLWFRFLWKCQLCHFTRVSSALLFSPHSTHTLVTIYLSSRPPRRDMSFNYTSSTLPQKAESDSSIIAVLINITNVSTVISEGTWLPSSEVQPMLWSPGNSRLPARHGPAVQVIFTFGIIFLLLCFSPEQARPTTDTSPC